MISFSNINQQYGKQLLCGLSFCRRGKLKVEICALLSPAKVNDDGDISVPYAGIIDPRPPIHITHPELYTNPNEVATGMQRLNLEPPEFIRKSGGKLQISSRYRNYGDRGSNAEVLSVFVD